MLVLTSKNFSGIPPTNIRIENLSSAPSSPYGPGHIYYDSSLQAFCFYDGSVFRNPRSRADHTGTQLSATISDLPTVVKGYSLDLFTPPAANLNANSFRITNLADPVNAQDGATKNWVTGLVQAAEAGISSKNPCRVVSTSNISSLSGTTTVDGVSLNVGDRVLLTAQSTASQNGPWVVQSAAWIRPSTEGAAYELESGAFWLVTAGTTYAGSQWKIATSGSITPGTTNISITQWGIASSVLAGNGLVLTSGTMSVQLQASSGLLSASNGLAIDTTVVARKYATAVGDGSSTSYTVNHNLGSRDVIVNVYQAASPYDIVEAEAYRTDTNNVTVTFGSAPASGAYRVVVLG